MQFMKALFGMYVYYQKEIALQNIDLWHQSHSSYSRV